MLLSRCMSILLSGWLTGNSQELSQTLSRASPSRCSSSSSSTSTLLSSILHLSRLSSSISIPTSAMFLLDTGKIFRAPWWSRRSGNWEIQLLWGIQGRQLRYIRLLLWAFNPVNGCDDREAVDEQCDRVLHTVSDLVHVSPALAVL